MPETATGTLLFVSVPFPSSANTFNPQQWAAPAVVTPQLWKEPALTDWKRSGGAFTVIESAC